MSRLEERLLAALLEISYEEAGVNVHPPEASEQWYRALSARVLEQAPHLGDLLTSLSARLEGAATAAAEDLKEERRARARQGSGQVSGSALDVEPNVDTSGSSWPVPPSPGPEVQEGPQEPPGRERDSGAGRTA